MATPPPAPLAARDHLRVKRGGRLMRSYQWTDGGVPVDLTGWTATFKARSASGAVKISLTHASGITLNADAVVGRVDVDAGTIAEPGQDYQVWEFDLQLTTPDGKPGYLTAGAIEVFGSAQ